jgi:hypothetical protein
MLGDCVFGEFLPGSLVFLGLARYQLYYPPRALFLPLWQGLTEKANGGGTTHPAC